MADRINERYSIDYTLEKIGIAAVFYIHRRQDPVYMQAALQQDYEDFMNLFEQMRFDVRGFSGEMNFSTAADTLNSLSTEMRNNHTSCFICLFIGHGGPGFINTTDGRLDILTDILGKFMPENCMPGRPKVFMFQTCRGTRDNRIRGFISPGTLAVPEWNPEGSDMLLCYASWQGFVSHARNGNDRGTRYLQALHNLLIEFANGTNNLCDILTLLNREISNSLIRNQEHEEVGFLQMPSFESSLRKKLFLTVGRRAPYSGPSGDSDELQGSPLAI